MTINTAFVQIEALAHDFQYIDGDTDTVILDVGFVATFFFWGGHTAQKRLALAECLEAYKTEYGSQLTWARDPDSWRAVKLSKPSFPSFREHIAPLDEDDAIEWYEASGDDPDEVSDYAVSCLTERGWEERQISCFQFQVPRRHIFDSEEKARVEALLNLCIERLTPFHGIAGLAVTTTEQEIQWQPEELDVATRYRALYIGYLVGDFSSAHNGIKSINWFTFVGDLLTERVGGPKAFLTYCERFEIVPERSTNGFIIRTGEVPELGLMGEPPSTGYVRANSALRPLRNARFGSMGNGSIDGELRFNRCTSDLWIRRFDGPNIWPPASFAGLPEGPVGTNPTKKVKLDTGKPCVVHGRYRKYPIDPELFNEDEEYDRTPMVVLLPGDIAPFHLTLGPHGEFVSREIVTWELIAEL